MKIDERLEEKMRGENEKGGKRGRVDGGREERKSGMNERERGEGGRKEAIG